MNNKELKSIIQKAAIDNDINGVMELVAKCDLSYERVSRVWEGALNAKLSDVIHVADVLGLKLKFISKGE